MAKEGLVTAGDGRWNPIFVWWALPQAGGNGLDGRLKRFQALTSDLQKACGDAYSNQMGTLLTANERIAGSLQELLGCRQPQDVIAAESNVLATVLEQASLQAKTWVELTQKVQNCCAAMARETADEIRDQAGEGAATKAPAKAASQPARDASRHPTRA